MTAVRKFTLKQSDIFVLFGVLLILVGFAPTFYLKPVFGAGKPLTSLILVHGITITAWIAVFLYQHFAASRGLLARHKEIGVAGAALFGIYITLSYVVVLGRAAAAASEPSGVAPLVRLAYPFWIITATLIFGLAAFILVRHHNWHRHFQLASFFILLAPATARALRFVVETGTVATFGSLLVSLALYIGATRLKDKGSNKASRLALGIVGAYLLVTLLIFLSVNAATPWLHFASALTGYPVPDVVSQ